MENLINSGLNLREIKAEDYQTLCENLQYNFNLLLTLSEFKGRKGDKGETVSTTGERGSLWFFAIYEKFKLAFPELQNPTEIGMSFLNEKLINDIDGLTTALTNGAGVNLTTSDIVVVPSGEVYQISGVENDIIFTETSITFSDISTLTVEQVISIVNSLLAPYQQGESFLSYKPIGKNASDESPSLNNELTTISTIDINVVGSGVGVEVPNYRLFAPTETIITENVKLGTLFGSPKKYHDILQRTQRELSNNYAPNYSAYPSLMVLQNDINSGITIGFGTTFKTFSKIYNNGSQLVIRPNSSPDSGENGQLSFGGKTFDLVTPDKISMTSKNIKIDGEIFSTNLITENKSTKNITIGSIDRTGKTTIYSSHIELTDIQSATLLSTDASGKIVTPYHLSQVIDANSNHTMVPTNKSVYDYVRVVASGLGANSFEGVVRIVTGTHNLNSYIKTEFLAFAPTTTTIYNKPTYVNTQFTNQVDHHLNVVFNPTVLGDNTNGVVLQQFFVANIGTNRTTTSVTSFMRVGQLVNGVVTFGVWNRNIDSNSVNIVGDNIISVSGALDSGNTQIKHAVLTPTTTTNAQTTKGVVGFTFDGYGHVKQVKEYDFSNVFLRSNASVEQNTIKGIGMIEAMNIQNNINTPKYITTKGIRMYSTTPDQYIWTPIVKTADAVVNNHNLFNYNEVTFMFKYLGIETMRRDAVLRFGIFFDIQYNPPTVRANDPYKIDLNNYDFNIEMLSGSFNGETPMSISDAYAFQNDVSVYFKRLYGGEMWFGKQFNSSETSTKFGWAMDITLPSALYESFTVGGVSSEIIGNFYKNYFRVNVFRRKPFDINNLMREL